MHGVKCSYADFDKTIGRNSDLRFYMETFLKCDDLWSDLEYSLSKLDIGAMSDTLDMWLDSFDAYDEDSQMADYYSAIDFAALPIEVLTSKLPKRFRKWIESLTIGSNNKPFQNMLKKNAIYLNFNYTEFLETVYGIDHENIKYIHGCRVKQNGKPKDEFVLGHMPFEEDEGHYIDESECDNGLVELARETLYSNWESCYEDTFAKKTPKIIVENSEFFTKSKFVQDIVLLGHSLAMVDYLYFEEIAKINNNKAMWYIGYYSLEDLRRLIALVDKLKIDKDKIILFRT